MRPIITLDGGHEVNDVFLENVKVPVENRIYEENKGWTCAKFLLAHERTGIAASRARRRHSHDCARSRPASARTARRSPTTGVPAQAGRARNRSRRRSNTPSCACSRPSTRARGRASKVSLLKIKGTEIQQRLTELTLEAVGRMPRAVRPRARPARDPRSPAHDAIGVAPTYFNMRKTSIYGGSNEIQRNIIAKAVLGL